MPGGDPAQQEVHGGVGRGGDEPVGEVPSPPQRGGLQYPGARMRRPQISLGPAQPWSWACSGISLQLPMIIARAGPILLITQPLSCCGMHGAAISADQLSQSSRSTEHACLVMSELVRQSTPMFLDDGGVSAQRA